jgi:tRNA dimethylallyltransferase
LVTIAGPTGAGKSSLALRLAAEFDGEIVNCDSLQLYRGFDIGTAKTPEDQRRGIPHRMIDVLDPAEGYSAGDYARTARSVLAEISARGRLPIVVGGTGFYLRALLDGLPQLPEKDEAIRQRLAERETRHAGSMHRILRRLDPAAAARIHANDTHKLIRALEVRILTGVPAPPRKRSDALEGYLTLKLGVNPDRKALHEVLDARAREMFLSGLVEEVRGLIAAGCSGDEKPFESLGYRQALEHLRGKLSLEQAIAATQIETRQYAKRQWTWFRRDREIVWLDGFGSSPEVIEKAVKLVRKHVGPALLPATGL